MTLSFPQADPSASAATVAPPLSSPSNIGDGHPKALPIQLDIPSPLIDFVSQQVLKWKFESAGDYLLNLILNHQEHMEIRDLIMEGLRAGPSRFFDQEYLDELQNFIEAAEDITASAEHEAR